MCIVSGNLGIRSFTQGFLVGGSYGYLAIWEEADDDAAFTSVALHAHPFPNQIGFKIVYNRYMHATWSGHRFCRSSS